MIRGKWKAGAVFASCNNMKNKIPSKNADIQSTFNL